MLCIALPYRQTSHAHKGGCRPRHAWHLGPKTGHLLVLCGLVSHDVELTTLHGITIDVEDLPDALGVLALDSNIRFEHIAPTLLCSVLTTACLWASGWRTWSLGTGSLPADSTYTVNCMLVSTPLRGSKNSCTLETWGAAQVSPCRASRTPIRGMCIVNLFLVCCHSHLNLAHAILHTLQPTYMKQVTFLFCIPAIEEDNQMVVEHLRGNHTDIFTQG